MIGKHYTPHTNGMERCEWFAFATTAGEDLPLELQNDGDIMGWKESSSLQQVGAVGSVQDSKKLLGG
jgi:hypothetical protein